MTTLEHKTTLRPSRALPPALVPEPKVPADPLTQTVQACVRNTDDAALRPVARLDAGVAFQPRTLLALLTYCYAAEIYGSNDIEDVMRRDAAFRRLCENEFPGALLLRRFRCQNRQTLHQCLENVLRQHAAKVNGALESNGHEAHAWTEEAARRIGIAMFMDQMALDLE